MATFDILKTGPKGPRFLSVQTEQNWLKAQEQKAAQGELLTALQMKESYEQLASRSVTLETIYKALHRNGWSKKQPRPRHPKGNEEAKTLFKKT